MTQYKYKVMCQACFYFYTILVWTQVSLRERERRESFEQRITRPHFHVKPIDEAQLKAWSEYLDFEQAQATGSEDSSSGGGRGGGGIGTAAALSAGRKRPRGGGGGGGAGRGLRGRGGGVERLFERCLVPCACYWWLWERYALWKVCTM